MHGEELVSVFGEIGIKWGCTLEDVHGECNVDMIPLRVSGTGSELRGGRSASCLERVSAEKRGALVALVAS